MRRAYLSHPTTRQSKIPLTTEKGTGGTVWNFLQAWRFDITFQANNLKQFNDVVAAKGGSIPGWYTFGQCIGGTVANDPFSMVQTDICELSRL